MYHPSPTMKERMLHYQHTHDIQGSDNCPQIIMLHMKAYSNRQCIIIFQLRSVRLKHKYVLLRCILYIIVYQIVYVICSFKLVKTCSSRTAAWSTTVKINYLQAFTYSNHTVLALGICYTYQYSIHSTRTVSIAVQFYVSA